MPNKGGLEHASSDRSGGEIADSTAAIQSLKPGRRLEGMSIDNNVGYVLLFRGLATNLLCRLH